MSVKGMSRRQFVTGAAVAAAATAVPVISNVSTAVADPGFMLPIAATQTSPWVPLDPTAAARQALEIYRSKHVGQGG